MSTTINTSIEVNDVTINYAYDSVGGAVDSVNGQTGVVVLDADDIDDASTTNKFVTSAEKTILSNTSGTNTGDQDISGIATNATAITDLQNAKLDSVVGGTNVTIDNTDPNNPVINASGGGSTYTAGDGIDITSDEISVDTSRVQVFDPLTHATPAKWIGTQAEYDVDFPSGHGDREVWITDATPPALTASDITDFDAAVSANTDVAANTTKLSGIEAGAEVNDTGAEIVSKIDTELGSTDWQSGGGSSSIDWQGEWVSGNYTVDQAVSYNGSSYICILNTVSNEVPTNTTYWDVLAEKGDTGATGATGSATGDVQLGFLHFDEFSDKFIIDLDAETITMDGFTCSILKSDGLKLDTPTTDQVLDFSTFNTNNVMVFVYWDDSDNLFHVEATFPVTYVDDADKYFITSFRRYTGQTNINLSFNQHAFRVKANDPEYISKWTILGDSHTQVGNWINECERVNGKINEYLRLGYSGSNVADISTNSFYDRRTQITADTDLLMIYGSTNDYNNDASLGAVQDGGTYTLTTTLGSLQNIIEYAYSLNGEMTIMLMSPMHHFDASSGGNQYTDVANGAGHTMQDYTDGIESVANYYNIPFLDLNSHIGVNEYNYTNYTADGTHLNSFAGEKAGRIVSEFIKSNF